MRTYVCQNGELVEARPIGQCEQAVVAAEAAAVAAADAAKAVVSSSSERLLNKVLVFPPIIAILLAMVLGLSNAVLPPEVASISSFMAAAHRPLVLTALGLVLPWTLEKNQLRMLVALLGVWMFCVVTLSLNDNSPRVHVTCMQIRRTQL